MYKKFTIQAAALISSKHSFKNSFRHTEQLSTRELGQLLLDSVKQHEHQVTMLHLMPSYDKKCSSLSASVFYILYNVFAVYLRGFLIKSINQSNLTSLKRRLNKLLRGASYKHEEQAEAYLRPDWNCSQLMFLSVLKTRQQRLVY